MPPRNSSSSSSRSGSMIPFHTRCDIPGIHPLFGIMLVLQHYSAPHQIYPCPNTQTLFWVFMVISKRPLHIRTDFAFESQLVVDQRKWASFFSSSFQTFYATAFRTVTEVPSTLISLLPKERWMHLIHQKFEVP